MIETALLRQNYSKKVVVSIKALVSIAIVALAVLLPQLVHMAYGPTGGMTFLPMYLPILLGGCILGYRYGLVLGVISPLVSFGITSLMGSPMPLLTRLPFMMFELGVFALVSGLFSKAILKNGWMAFPAVILATCAGRLSFLLAVAIFQSVSPLSLEVVYQQVITGLLGVVIQAIFVPFMIMLIRKILVKQDNE